MRDYFEGLNIIDLISEKHALLRKKVIETWISRGEESISDTETYVLALIERENMTVSQIGRTIGISRQGAHKCVKGLIERGYIQLEDPNSIHRDKKLLLTEKGTRFCKETLALKKEFEEEIKNSLGEEKFKILKDSLNKKWL